MLLELTVFASADLPGRHLASLNQGVKKASGRLLLALREALT